KEMTELAAAQFEMAMHDLNSIQQAIDRDSVELSNLRTSIAHSEWVLVEYDQKRTEFAEVVSKLFVTQPDHEEEYYSRVLDRAVKIFYKNYLDVVNVKAALRSVTRAHNLMARDTRIGGGEYINIAAVENMFFSLHFLDLAHSYWPNLKRIEISNLLESDKFSSISTARLDILKSHIANTQNFLNNEVATVTLSLQKTFEKLDVLSNQLANARLRVLESRLQTATNDAPRILQPGSRDLLFKLDKTFLKNVVQDKVAVSNEEEIGRAAGLNYLDYEFSSLDSVVAALPPDY
ncbi:hypothetical protein HK100_003699, partial [Physocladia obscura]